VIRELVEALARTIEPPRASHRYRRRLIPGAGYFRATYEVGHQEHRIRNHGHAEGVDAHRPEWLTRGVAVAKAADSDANPGVGAE